MVMRRRYGLDRAKKKQLCAWVNYISDHTKVTGYISGHHLRLLGKVRHIYIWRVVCLLSIAYNILAQFYKNKMQF
jgi:hypothetical protein